MGVASSRQAHQDGTACQGGHAASWKGPVSRWPVALSPEPPDTFLPELPQDRQVELLSGSPTVVWPLLGTDDSPLGFWSFLTYQTPALRGGPQLCLQPHQPLLVTLACPQLAARALPPAPGPRTGLSFCQGNSPTPRACLPWPAPAGHSPHAPFSGDPQTPWLASGPGWKLSLSHIINLLISLGSGSNLYLLLLSSL